MAATKIGDRVVREGIVSVGPIKVQKSDGSLVTVADTDGNVDAPVTTTDLTATGNTTLGNGGADTTQANSTVTVGVDDTGYDVKFFGATAGRYWLWDESADGVVQLGTLTVGVDDTGHDVKFFGATAGKSWLWDESADKMIVTGTSDLLGNTQQTGTFTVGVDDTGHDVKFFGATSGKYFEWDESANKVNIVGDLGITGILTVNSTAKIQGTSSTFLAPFIAVGAQEIIAAGTGGAISVATHMTDLSTDAGGDAFTLASGTDIGQLKYILMTTDGGGDAVITAAFSGGNNTLTMADAGDYALLIWDGSAWATIELGNRVDGVTKPVVSTV